MTRARYELTFTAKPQPDRGPITDDEIRTVVVWAHSEEKAIRKAKNKVPARLRYYSVT